VTALHACFRVDSGPGIGGGHLSRCLALGAALRTLGADFTVAAARFGDGDVDRVTAAGGTFVALDADCTFSAIVARVNAGSVVVDHYGLDAAFEQPLRAHGVQVAVIDDLADRDHDCDVLLDPAWGASAGTWLTRVPPQCRLLLGTRYALLAPVFEAARRALDTSTSASLPDGPLRVHVWFGTDDAGGCTRRFVPRLLASERVAHVHAVLRGSHADRDALVALAAASGGRLHLALDAPDLVASLEACDVAIGAPGHATWERACLGLPAAYVSVSANQAPIVERLAHAGFCVDLGLLDTLDDERFDTSVERFLGDRAQLATLRSRSLDACDGRGARRVAEVLTRLAAGRA
jgi:UDP-2,4-diacetamido-2,4,6-trideoxy-beta-L-altropyranose hydrolase